MKYSVVCARQERAVTDNGLLHKAEQSGKATSMNVPWE